MPSEMYKNSSENFKKLFQNFNVMYITGPTHQNRTVRQLYQYIKNEIGKIETTTEE
jgi:hypothetical protein